jgi:hypothetical protein
MIAIIPEPVIGMPGTPIGIVRNPHLSRRAETGAVFPDY